MIVNVIIEGMETNSDVNRAGLQDWADTYGLTMPVVFDPQGGYMWSHIDGNSVTLPYTEVLDQGAVVDELKTGTLSDAEKLAD